MTAILKANVSSLVNGMKQAEKATSDFAKKSSKSATDNKKDWEQLGRTSMIAGGLLAVGVGLAVKSFMDFDKSMSGVKAVANATAGEMDKLRGAALKAGADTKYSASEAAKAEEELAKVGISTADILAGALTGSLNLAAAGNLDLGEAAAISGKAMKIFSLAGKDVGHIADVMAAGANKSAADVTDLGQALAQGGLIAAQTGLTLEDTVGTLAAFADNALMGSDAGTAMKTMLMRLNPQSDEAASLMDELGLRAYDANGEFVGMAEYAGKLQTKLSGLSDEQRNATLTTLFGSDAVRGANILYKIGADGVREYTNAVNDEGAAARMAAIQMDNLSGDLEQLKGSIETALIQAGSGGNDALRSLAQTATDAVNAFGDLPEPVQKSALGLAAITSAGLLTVGMVGTMYPKFVSTRQALDRMTGSSSRTAGALGQLGKSAGIAVTLLAVGSAIDRIVRSGDKAPASLAQTSAALGTLLDSSTALDALFKDTSNFGEENITGMADALNRLANPGLEQRLNILTQTVTFGRIKSGQDALSAQFDKVGQSLAELVTGGNANKAGQMFDAMAVSAKASGKDVAWLMDLMPAYRDALLDADGAQATAEGGTDALAGAQTELASETEKTTDAVNGYYQSLIDAGMVVLDTRAAQRGLTQAQRDSTEALKENGRTLKDGTVKGDANAAALDNQAKAATGLAQAIYAETGSEDKMRASLVRSRASLIETGMKFGLTRAQATKYADSVIKIPDSKVTKVILNGVPAAVTAADRLQARINKLHGKNLNVHTSYTGTAPGQGHTAAAGGYIRGPGTTTSDSIPSLLSDKEYVVKAKAVDYYGVGTMDAINSMRFAAGGYTGPSPSTTAASSLGNTVRLDKATIRALGREIATRPNVLDGQVMAASVDRRLVPR